MKTRKRTHDGVEYTLRPTELDHCKVFAHGQEIGCVKSDGSVWLHTFCTACQESIPKGDRVSGCCPTCYDAPDLSEVFQGFADGLVFAGA